MTSRARERPRQPTTVLTWTSGTCGCTSPPTTALVKSVDGLSFHLERGKTLGIVGESGSGKSRDEHGGDGLQRQERADQRLDHARRAGAGRVPTRTTIRRLRGKKMAMIFQDPLSSMHPFYTVGNQIIEAYRIHNDVSKKAARAHAIEMLDRVGIPEPIAARRRLPAPVLRRDAAARDDRDGALLRPRPADRRRADHRARRHRPGADPRPDPRPAEGVQLRGRDHHPRPGRGGRARRRHHGDVRRPGGRVRQRRTAVQRARAPLHLGTPRLDAALRQGADRAAAADQGHAAEPDQRARRGAPSTRAATSRSGSGRRA